MTAIIDLPLRHSVTMDFVWPDDVGDPLDLTGWTVSAFDVSPALADKIDVSVTDAATGAVRVVILSAPDLPLKVTTNGFRLQAVPPAGADFTKALPGFVVRAK